MCGATITEVSGDQTINVNTHKTRIKVFGGQTVNVDAHGARIEVSGDLIINMSIVLPAYVSCALTVLIILLCVLVLCKYESYTVTYFFSRFNF